MRERPCVVDPILADGTGKASVPFSPKPYSGRMDLGVGFISWLDYPGYLQGLGYAWHIVYAGEAGCHHPNGAVRYYA